MKNACQLEFHLNGTKEALVYLSHNWENILFPTHIGGTIPRRGLELWKHCDLCWPRRHPHTCDVQRCIAADCCSDAVARDAGVDALVWRTAATLSHAQEEEAALRQNHRLHVPVSLWGWERLAIPEPFEGDLRAAFCPARQPRRTQQFHHHVRGVVDNAWCYLLCVESGNCEDRENQWRHKWDLDDANSSKASPSFCLYLFIGFFVFCRSTFESIYWRGKRAQRAYLSAASNKVCVFASSAGGMPLFGLPLQSDGHAEGNDRLCSASWHSRLSDPNKGWLKLPEQITSATQQWHSFSWSSYWFGNRQNN